MTTDTRRSADRSLFGSYSVCGSIHANCASGHGLVAGTVSKNPVKTCVRTKQIHVRTVKTPAKKDGFIVLLTPDRLNKCRVG